MSTSLIQLSLKCIIFGLVLLPISTIIIRSKRAPLESGLISFHRPSKVQARNFLKDKIKIDKSKGSETISVQHPVIIPEHSRRIWIPGHVYRHSYIPAHIHHVLISNHALLLTRTVHALLIPQDSENIYRSHIGGYGIGVDFGGQGAGHGFQVSF